jgi:hypothetical protein
MEEVKVEVQKLHEIRLDIIRRQTVNWSAHIYPFVASLNRIMDLLGMEYEKDTIKAVAYASRKRD